MLFWIVAIGLGLGATALLVRPVLAARHGAGRAESARRVYVAQLAEVESDLARGVISETEAAALRTEVSRRLLGTEGAAGEAGNAAPAGATGAMAVLVAVFVVGGAAGLYAVIGAPGAADQPRAARLAEAAAAHAARPSQAEAEATFASRPEGVPPPIEPEQAALLDRLRDVLETRPDDLQGHKLLSNTLVELGQWSAAAKAQAQVARISGPGAAAEHAAHAQFMILASGGYVSPEAEAALRTALAADPDLPGARFLSGINALQAGRPDIAFDLWARLLAESPPNAPWVAMIEAQIFDVALAAGRRPPEIRQRRPGPTREDLEAAATLGPEAQTEMAEGMVARLAERLGSEGGPAEDWAMLIRALSVLGERGRANEIYNEATEAFAGAPRDLSILREAARAAELIQ